MPSVSAVNPSLSLTMETPDQRSICDTIPVKFTVKNDGSGRVQNVVIHEQLPQGLTTEDNKDVLDLNAGTLDSGQSKDFTVNLKATSAGTFKQEANATSCEGLKVRAVGQTTVTKLNLRFKITGPDTLYVGACGTYTINLKVGGDAEGRDVKLMYNAPECTETGQRRQRRPGGEGASDLVAGDAAGRHRAPVHVHAPRESHRDHSQHGQRDGGVRAGVHVHGHQRPGCGGPGDVRDA